MNSTTRSAIAIITQRELLVKLRDKAFVGSTIFLVLTVAVSIILPSVLFGDNPRLVVGAVGTEAVAVARSAAELGRLAGEDEPSREVAGLPAARIDVREFGDAAAAEAAVRDGLLDAALLPPSGGAGNVDLVADREVPGELTTLAASAVANRALAATLAEAGLDDATARDRLASIAGAAPGERLLDPRADDAEIAKGLGVAFSFVFFLASFLFGFSIAQSVVEEKQSRVVELLVAAVPVRALLAGKVIANTILAMAQATLLLAAGAVGAAVVDQAAVLQLILSSGGVFLVFFVLGFGMLATLWAACGAVSSRQEDLQSSTVPMQVVLYLPFFAAVYISEPGLWMRILSYVPFTAPLSMPQRLMIGDAAWWEAVISALIVLVTAAALVAVAARLYERNLMRMGGRIPWLAAWRA